jgi:hypothetical protein
MPCKDHKSALIEAAASGARPQGDLRAHLDVCVPCRAAFEQEQCLFASIDAGLHAAANADVPASLLPGVRVRLQREPPLSRSWLTNWLVLASAAGVLVTLFAVRAVWRTGVERKPVETAGKTSVPPSVTPAPQNRDPVVVPAAGKNSVSQRQFAMAGYSPVPETMVRGKTMPEVLVPGDQEILLAEYAEQWRLHARPLLLAQDFEATILSPLRVVPIQIAELDVKLLAEEKSQ